MAQVFSKKIIMTIYGFEAKVNSEIKLYKEDNIVLSFQINQLNVETSDKGTTNSIIPLTGVSAKMLIKIPNDNVPISIETTEIDEETESINFRFTVPYVNYVGQSQMQIVLTDSLGNIVHCPPVNVQIGEPLGLLDDDDVAHSMTVETNRDSVEVSASKFVYDADTNDFKTIINHTIADSDGNVFVSVIDSTTLADVTHYKKVINENSFELHLNKITSVKVSIRK